MKPIAFCKYEALGNDFVLIPVATDELSLESFSPDLGRAMCDRRLGVGADGVILIAKPSTEGHAARIRIWNADGSVPEMCGNGVRCVAHELLRTRGLSDVTIETDAGPRLCRSTAAGASTGRVDTTVDMGEARVGSPRKVSVLDRTIEVYPVSVGNPHGVVLSPFPPEEVERLGPALGTHESFPDGANIEFVRLDDGEAIVTVWERGVGFSMACGTGACAVASVLGKAGLASAGAPIRVQLPGGALTISVGQDSVATMTGPSRLVFQGKWGAGSAGAV